MISIRAATGRILFRNVEKQYACLYSDNTTDIDKAKKDEFRALNLKNVKGTFQKREPRKHRVFPQRSHVMEVDQDWGSVWPGPRTFHPATVPLPIRQGFVKKGAPPGKYGNAEIMKIPNFLHLTPPVIKRQCEALKQFCTPWPKALDTDENIVQHFPMEIITSDYCHSSPTIRDPLARIVTIRVKVEKLNLNKHAKDKLLRLVDDRYDENTDTLTIVTDRCPARKQNLDYAMYLLTALYHESWVVEPWEEMKSEADMEYYDWQKNASRKSIEELFGLPYSEIPSSNNYISAVDKLMNEGESEYTICNYEQAVRELLNLPSNIK